MSKNIPGVEIKSKDDTCTWELCIKITRKMHKRTKKHKRRLKSELRHGENWFNPTGFTVWTELKWCPDVVPRRGRKNTVVRTRRITVRTNQPYHSGTRNTVRTSPSIPSGRFTQKIWKRAEKYFQNNFQSTYVYNTDILVQLAFIKNPRYNWELSFNHNNNFLAEEHFSIENSTQAISVCVKAFSIRYEIHW
jgi:hypothetical protein